MHKTVLVLFVLIGTSPLYPHPSWGLVIDGIGNFYFADIHHNGRGSVWKLSREGKLTLLLSDFHAHNVNLDKDGNLITAHGEETYTMLRLLPGGKKDTLFHGTDFKAFNGGNASYTPSGEIIFGIEKRIWRINAEGKREKVSDHKFAWNQTVYGDAEGNYYGPDIGDGRGKLIKIDPTGKASVIATDLISKLDRPYEKHNDVLLGINKGPDGHIYLAELAGQRIIRILSGQRSETFYRSEGHWFPTAIAFHKGEAFILEYKSKNGHEGPRIIRLDHRGKASKIFNYDSYHTSHADTKKRDKNWLLLGGTFFPLLIFAFLVFKRTGKISINPSRQ